MSEGKSTKNPNSPANRMKRWIKGLWWAPNLPGGEPNFQPMRMLRDLCILAAIGGTPLFFAKVMEGASQPTKSSSSARSNQKKDGAGNEGPSVTGSQIIDFEGRRAFGSTTTKGFVPGASPRGTGTLVRIRLQNTVETYSAAPVHAQIVDSSLGAALYGSVLLGEASADSNFNRIYIQFSTIRPRNSVSDAYSINAVAMSLNGTLGLEATKKEGLLARGTLATSGGIVSGLGSKGGSGGSGLSLQDLLVKALVTGLQQEAGNDLSVEQARSQVLVLDPGIEFFAELKSKFPDPRGN